MARERWVWVWWRFLGALFVWAGASKLADPTAFLASLNAYQLGLPLVVKQGIVIGLPVFECLCGGGVVFGVWSTTTRLSLVGLLVVFTVAVGQAWVRGLDLSCGCFHLGIGAGWDLSFLESAGFAVGRNCVLLGVTAVLCRSGKRE